MNMATKKDIFEEHLRAWRAARKDRKQRGGIIDHLCFVTGMHRNSVSRKFRAIQLRTRSYSEARGRAVYYTPDVTAALKDVWNVGDEACGELLHPQVAEYIDILIRDRMWHHSDEATAKLRSMSERTMKRRVEVFEHARGLRKGLSGTKPSALKSIIPIFKGPWRDLPPGHEQIDTVAHCGETLVGDFAYSLSAIDSALYWSNTRAQWNKGQEATTVSMDAIRQLLPFPWLSAHPDTGSEFINWQVKGWCDAEGISMSRSEPGKKNDNMYVEERNGHVVRRYLGYIRLDDPDVVPLMNELYDVLARYLNHFVPVRRTLSKERVGAKYRRTFEKRARTPYTRLLEHPKVSKQVKTALAREHDALNPLLLKRQIDTLRARIFDFKKRGHGTETPPSS